MPCYKNMVLGKETPLFKVLSTSKHSEIKNLTYNNGHEIFHNGVNSQKFVAQSKWANKCINYSDCKILPTLKPFQQDLEATQVSKPMTNKNTEYNHTDKQHEQNKYICNFGHGCLTVSYTWLCNFTHIKLLLDCLLSMPMCVCLAR